MPDKPFESVLTEEELWRVWRDLFDHPERREHIAIAFAGAVERMVRKRLSEVIRSIPVERPHPRYSHWTDIGGVELRELIAAAIVRGKP